MIDNKNKKTIDKRLCLSKTSEYKILATSTRPISEVPRREQK